jgi:hypothetical protein
MPLSLTIGGPDAGAMRAELPPELRRLLVSQEGVISVPQVVSAGMSAQNAQVLVVTRASFAAPVVTGTETGSAAAARLRAGAQLLT